MNQKLKNSSMSEVATIQFTPVKLTQLKMSCGNAVECGENMFIFEGHELLTDYAKYLIEYLDTQLK
jgi:hypothetical protein